MGLIGHHGYNSIKPCDGQLLQQKDNKQGLYFWYWGRLSIIRKSNVNPSFVLTYSPRPPLSELHCFEATWLWIWFSWWIAKQSRPFLVGWRFGSFYFLERMRGKLDQRMNLTEAPGKGSKSEMWKNREKCYQPTGKCTGVKREINNSFCFISLPI